MPLYRKKPVVIEAHQWWRNGDHPEDRVGEVETGPLGDTYERMEGAVVRFFRRPEPEYAGHLIHDDCGAMWHEHGWIDTIQGGHTVCPGDWILPEPASVGDRRYYPCNPTAFAETFDPEEPCGEWRCEAVEIGYPAASCTPENPHDPPCGFRLPDEVADRLNGGEE